MLLNMKLIFKKKIRKKKKHKLKHIYSHIYNQFRGKQYLINYFLKSITKWPHNEYTIVSPFSNVILAFSLHSYRKPGIGCWCLSNQRRHTGIQLRHLIDSIKACLSISWIINKWAFVDFDFHYFTVGTHFGDRFYRQ